MRVVSTKDGVSTDITALIVSATITGDYMQAARSLAFSMLVPLTDGSIPAVDIELGDVIQVFELGQELFYGFVFKKDKTTDSSAIDVLCYDGGIFLKRNRASYQYSNTMPEVAVAQLCQVFDIETGVLEPTGEKFSRKFLGVDLYSIIIGSYYQASLKNGKKYMIRFSENKLNVIEKGKLENAQILESGYNLLSSAVSESIVDMVNAVAIFNENDIPIEPVTEEMDIKKYGRMQEYYKIGKEDDYMVKAKAKLKGVERKINVTNFGNIECITGNAVVVQEPFTGLYGYFYIDSDTHSWQNGIYTNSLTLNFENLMDEKEVEQLPASKKNSIDGSKPIQWTPDSQRPLYNEVI